MDLFLLYKNIPTPNYSPEAFITSLKNYSALQSCLGLASQSDLHLRAMTHLKILLKQQGQSPSQHWKEEIDAL